MMQHLQLVTISEAASDQFNAEAAFLDGGEGQRQDVYGVADPGPVGSLSGAVGLAETESDQYQLWTFPPANGASVSPLGTYHNLKPPAPAGLPQETTREFMPPLLYDPGIQQVRSIETLDQSNVQLCGTSAELDPWLLRHCKFDDVGMRPYGKIRIRNVGGVPVDNMVPVHFTVVDDAFYESIESRPSPAKSPEVRRRELNSVVPPELGLQLISL